MIRRACYMMSYVAFESFNAFSFLCDSRTSWIFPIFARPLKRTIRYIHGNNRHEIARRPLEHVRHFLHIYTSNDLFVNLCRHGSLLFPSKIRGESFSLFSQNFRNHFWQRSTAFTTINGVYCGHRGAM